MPVALCGFHTDFAGIDHSMGDEFKRGDRVEWNFGRGKAVGVVERKLTSRTKIGKQNVAASEDDPRYVVKSQKSGKEAAHKPSALRRA